MKKIKSFDFQKLFEFIKIAEKLKTELRHSWTSDTTRRESVAEHVWMTCLLAIIIIDNLDVKIDKLKAIKILIVHDIVESLAGDIPAFEKSDRKSNNQKLEGRAIKDIAEVLGGEGGEEIRSLWKEYEERETNEGKFAYALDKAEVLIQHNIADIETWDDGDYGYTFVDKQDKPFNFDNFMREFKNEIDDWSYKKLKKAGMLDKIPNKHRKDIK